MSKLIDNKARQTLIWDIMMLFLTFFIVFVVSIFPKGWHLILYSGSYTLLFFSAAMTMGKNKKKMLAIISIAIIMEWVSSLLDLAVLESISEGLNFCFFTFLIGYYINQIAQAKNVTSGVIFQAIIGYLLLGLIFSILVGILVQFNPGMFSFSTTIEPGSEGSLSEYIYFGFVTMSTLGYGDIVPLMPFSRSLSILISVSGQLYLAILIALLVGKYASHKEYGKTDKNHPNRPAE